MRRITLLLLLAGCGGNQIRCDRMIDAICEHEIECNRETDVTSCSEAMHSRWGCEEAATPEQFDACTDEVSGTTCQVAYPESCTAVLCAVDHCGTTTPSIPSESGVYAY